MFDLNKAFDKLKTDIDEYIPTLIKTFLIFLLFLVAANWVKNYMTDKINNNISSEHTQDIIISQLGSICYFIILTIGILFSLVNLGFHVSTLIAVVATFGLALGLGMKDLIGNMIAGIYITFIKLFNLGDIIKVENVTGQVLNFNLFTTTIIDEHTNVPIIIPNTTIQQNFLINYSINQIIMIQIQIPLIITNYSNYKNITPIIKQTLQNCDYIIDKNKISINLGYLQDSPVINLICPIYSMFYYPAKKDINKLINNVIWDF